MWNHAMPRYISLLWRRRFRKSKLTEISVSFFNINFQQKIFFNHMSILNSLTLIFSKVEDINTWNRQSKIKNYKKRNWRFLIYSMELFMKSAAFLIAKRFNGNSVMEVESLWFKFIVNTTSEWIKSRRKKTWFQRETFDIYKENITRVLRSFIICEGHDSWKWSPIYVTLWRIWFYHLAEWSVKAKSLDVC